jgi:hypothetical protein
MTVEKQAPQQIVMPAKAGIQAVQQVISAIRPARIPAFAGMTVVSG